MIPRVRMHRDDGRTLKNNGGFDGIFIAERQVVSAQCFKAGAANKENRNLNRTALLLNFFDDIKPGVITAYVSGRNAFACQNESNNWARNLPDPVWAVKRGHGGDRQFPAVGHRYDNRFVRVQA